MHPLLTCFISCRQYSVSTKPKTSVRKKFSLHQSRDLLEVQLFSSQIYSVHLSTCLSFQWFESLCHINSSLNLLRSDFNTSRAGSLIRICQPHSLTSPETAAHFPRRSFADFQPTARLFAEEMFFF